MCLSTRSTPQKQRRADTLPLSTRHRGEQTCTRHLLQMYKLQGLNEIGPKRTMKQALRAHQQRVVCLDGLQRASHRHALAAAVWASEMTSWRALGRCGRDRGPRKALRREPTPFRYFPLYECYRLCPQCGLRSAAPDLAWPLARSVENSGDAFSEEAPSSGVLLRCRMHGARQTPVCLLYTSPSPRDRG